MLFDPFVKGPGPSSGGSPLASSRPLRACLTMFAALTLLSLGAAGCAEVPADTPSVPTSEVGHTHGALSSAQCSFFAVDGNVTLCHAANLNKGKFVLLRTNEWGCIAGHSGHDGDFISLDGTCNNEACFPVGAPYDGTVECCDHMEVVGGLCACEAGYESNGMTCDDVDECLDPTTCDENATCANTIGSFECACNPGFSGDGFECSACPPGEVQPEPGQATCTPCEAGTWADGTETCATCTSCGDEEFVVSACSASQDTVCASCTSCADGEYAAVACAASADTVCESCTSCGEGEYASVACSASADTVCASCTSCGEGEYASVACSASADTVCASCTSCGEGEYASSACSASADTVCASCTSCGADEYAAVACSATEDTVCETCTSCGADEYAAVACSASADTV